MHKMISVIKLVLSFITIYSALGACPDVLPRKTWSAADSKETRLLMITPPTYIVVHHTNGGECNETKRCSNMINGIQNYAMTTRKFNDIPYHYLIGGDGNVYEGRSYGLFGEHSEAYDDRSVAIGIMGNYTEIAPKELLINVLENFIACLKEEGKVTPTFKLIGHGQSEYVTCPGEKLQQRIEKLPEWSPYAD